MSRSLRINYCDAIYHAMNRGAGFKLIFLSNEDRTEFLNLLRYISERYRLQVLAYCLMDNHYHLLIKTPHANLSPAMRHLNSLYARYFNRQFKTDGPLFRGRFKSNIIDGDFSLLAVSRYIHLNPVKAHMVEKAEDFQWSSCRLYYGLPTNYNLIDSSLILSLLAEQNSTSHYIEFMQEQDELSDHYDDNNLPSIIGTDLFQESILKLRSNKSREISLKLTKTLPSIHFIKKTVANYYGINIKQINQISKKSNIPRTVSMWLCQSVGRYPLRQIAKAFGNHTASSISLAIYRLKQNGVKNIQLMVDIRQIEIRLSETSNNYRHGT